MELTFGQYIEGKITANDSHYSRIQGRVRSIDGEYVEVSAKRVIFRCSEEWKPHPTHCSISVKISNVKPIELKQYLVHVEYKQDGSTLHDIVRTEAVSETHAEDKVRRQWETAIKKDSAVLSFFQGMKLKSFSAQKA